MTLFDDSWRTCTTEGEQNPQGKHGHMYLECIQACKTHRPSSLGALATTPVDPFKSDRDLSPCRITRCPAGRPPCSSPSFTLLLLLLLLLVSRNGKRCRYPVARMMRSACTLRALPGAAASAPAGAPVLAQVVAAAGLLVVAEPLLGAEEGVCPLRAMGAKCTVSPSSSIRSTSRPWSSSTPFGGPIPAPALSHLCFFHTNIIHKHDG